MAKGFTTYIWGPFLWSLLHTVAAACPQIPHIKPWLSSLKYCLPCSFCRESFSTFLGVMEDRYGELDNVIQQRTLDHWMYDIHNLVTDKLDKQHAKEALGPLFEQIKDTDAWKSRRPTFACVQKRYNITPVSFCPQDIWDLLSIFSLNYPNSIQTEEDHIKAVQFSIFLDLLPSVLAATAERISEEAQSPLRKVLKRFNRTPMQIEDLVSQENMFAWVCTLQYGPNITPGFIQEQKTRYLIAQAGNCVDGSCI